MRLLRAIDPKLKRNIRPYLFQCFLVFAALLFVLWLGDAHLARAVIVAAIGSTAFVLFVYPNSASAAPRRVLGGHLVSLVIGSCLATADSTITVAKLISAFPFLFDVEAAMAVAISIFVMAATDTEHAPAAGTALGIVAHGFSWELVSFFAISVAILSLIHRLLRPYLHDLL